MASIFPFVQPQKYEETSSELPLCVDVEWDFRNDKPVFRNGKPVFTSGLPAVLSWAIRALKTPRFDNEIYTWDYGCEVGRLKGEDWDDGAKKAEAERYVRECLTQYPYITGISNVETDFDNGELKLAATIETVYGNARLEVAV